MDIQLSKPIRYSRFEELTPVTRGDDIVLPQPYAGVAVFRDGRYIIAGRDRGLLVLVDENGLVISSGDPLSLRYSPTSIICYGIALNIDEESLYLLIGEGEDSHEMYLTRIEILQDNTFKWHPAFDIRLPSTVARNADYATFHPVYWGPAYNPDFIQASALQWLTHLLRNTEPTVIDDWTLLKDQLAVDLTEFPMLGPILPEYKPSITSVGSRVLVSCTSVQLYQASFDMFVWFDGNRYSPEGVQQMWQSHIQYALKKKGLLDGEKDWYDYFPYGRDKWWYVDYDPKTYKSVGFHLHQKVTFQYPFPASSVVTVYPDLGMIDGIAHTGSATVCAVPRDGEAGMPWNHKWPYPPSVDHDHKDLNKYFTANIMASEADVELHLARNEYVVPSNVLVWADLPPWGKEYGTTVYDSFRSFFDWWIDVYRKQSATDPIALVRKYPQDTTPVLMGMTRESNLCRTRRDGARKGVAATQYKAESLVYPWSVIDGIQASCTEICTGTVMAVTPTKILRGSLALHRLISSYKGRYLGEGLDIYVGKVLIGKPKVVDVIFQHAGFPLVQLKNIHISVVPDANYPYYRFIQLSRDGQTWSDSIEFSEKQLVAVEPGVKPEYYQFPFFVKVECDSTQEDPKPVILKTTYERVGA